MSKIPYTKVPLTYKEQLQQLKYRGLVIENEDKALHLLEVVSYYRLSGYWYPLLANKEDHVFKADASFDTVFKLYCFDRELRKLLSCELEKIEIAIRAKMIYVLSHNHGAFWYQNANLFYKLTNHAKSLNNIQQEFERSDEQFIQAFKNKYSDELPPSWMLMEITSFGTLSMLFQNLIPGINKREVAHFFGLDDKTFSSWMHSLVYLRNICAHHTRLWNRILRIQPRIPGSPKNTWLINKEISNNRTYFILAIIIYLLSAINPHHTFKSKLFSLLEKYPNVHLRSLGFPDDWKTEELWK